MLKIKPISLVLVAFFILGCQQNSSNEKINDTQKHLAENGLNTINEIPRIIGTVLFGCKPGNNPAAVPKTIPKPKAKNISIIRK